MQSGACISSNKSILPSLAVWYVVSCLIFSEIVDIQQWKARCAQIGLEYDPAAGASSMVSAVKDHQVSELVSANSKLIVT